MGTVEDGDYSGERKKVKEKKMKRKKRDRKYKGGNGIDLMGALDADTIVDTKRKKKMHCNVSGNASEHVDGESLNMLGFLEVGDGGKKKRKRKSSGVDYDYSSLDVQTKTTEVVASAEVASSDITKKKKKKRKKAKIHEKADSGAERKQTQGTSGGCGSEDTQNVDSLEVEADPEEKKNNLKKTKELPMINSEHYKEKKFDEGESSKKSKKRKTDADVSDSSKKTESKKKRVTFSDTVEIFNMPEHLKYRKLNSEGDLVQGKRYTPEEDVKIIEAIDDYILEHHMANNDVDRDLNEDWKIARNMIMNCKEHPKLKGCWKDISLAIPWRTPESIYQRAHLIYERAEDRKWTKEEINMILSFHKKNGPKWRQIGDAMGKSRKHVKDAFRRNKLVGEKKGAWSQEEYQKLFDLVNHDICLKALEEKKVKHGMLRDNIAWGAISESIGTRASPTCCNKWYYQLCSSMVVEGKWSDTDDYKLVDALYNHDACCIEDVEWNRLLKHRSGDLCQKRWAEMARNLGEHRLKPFLEQVEILHQRYDQDMVEAREIYEKKEPVDV